MEDLALLAGKAKKVGYFLCGLLVSSLFLPLTGKQIVIATFVYALIEGFLFYRSTMKK